MNLSLSEAATVLGRSERQLRYLIKTGRLTASKQGGQWRIASADLPLTDAQRRSLANRLEAAQTAFTEGTAAAGKAAASGKSAAAGKSAAPGKAAAPGEEQERRHYSVLNLAAFQTGEALYRELDGEPGDQDPARRSLGAALTAIVCGFHCFQPAEKARRFNEARESAASAVAALLLSTGGSSKRPTPASRGVAATGRCWRWSPPCAATGSF